jgi:hypothetical protein
LHLDYDLPEKVFEKCENSETCNSDPFKEFVLKYSLSKSKTSIPRFANFSRDIDLENPHHFYYADERRNLFTEFLKSFSD